MIEYKPDKWIWTHHDFDTMGWHDCLIHGIGFDQQKSQIMFDLDYILSWVLPEGEKYYQFWIAPSTLVFEEVSDLKLDISYDFMEIEIEDVTKEESRQLYDGTSSWKWYLNTHAGEISFWATGYKQYIRKKPVCISSQVIRLTDRGGISFLMETGEGKE